MDYPATCIMSNIITEKYNFSENTEFAENVIIVRSREANKFEQVKYLRSSVVQKLSRA